MPASINTNYGALVALQSLNASSRELDQVQNRISTGLKVASAKDNGAVFAIAEGLRVRMSALSAVTDGIDRAVATVDTAISAGASIGNVLKTMRDKAAQAQTLTDAGQRATLQSDFATLRASIDQIANSATLNGVNLVNGNNLTGSASALRVLTSDTGGVSSGAVGGFSTTGSAVSSTGILVSGDTKLKDIVSGAIAANDIADGDTVAFTFRNTLASASDDTVYNIVIDGDETINQFLDRVKTETGGVVSGSYDSTTGKITWSNNEQFSIQTSGTASAAAGNFLGDGRTALQALTSGFSTTSGSLGAVTEDSDLLTALGANWANGDGLQIFDEFGNELGAVTIATGDSIATFITNVETASGGAVKARLNSDNTLSFYGNAKFRLGANDAAGANLTAAQARVLLGSTADTPANVTGAALNGEEFQTTLSAAVSGSTSTTSSSSPSSVYLEGYNFKVGTAGQALAGVDLLDIANDPNTAVATLDAAIAALNKQVGVLGGRATALEAQKDFLGKLGDTIEASVGKLVDADLAKESARLQSLQIKQQLGAQALSIANQQPSILLSFFR